ncbi:MULTISPECIES: hypothetical protein [unclassified Streptomyces]|uniref:hypothetical protein n=1 Tax=unclassified Streptomyces TaxID=2593676 RepID=UPI003818C88D
MASLIYFKKISEQSDSICYAFGEDPEEMTRQLIMNTETRTSTPGDDQVNYAYLNASRKINAVFEERKQWPERGMSVS